MKKFILNLFVSLLSVVIFFSIAEGICRIYVKAKHKRNEYENLIEQQGFKTNNKKAGEKRIVIVGESAARGVPYNMDSSFSGFLGKVTADVDPNIKIVNTGMPGRHSFYQKEEGPTILEYHPDAVIIYAGNNDTRDFSNVMRDMPFAYIEFKLFWNSSFYWVMKRKFLGISHKIHEKTRKAPVIVNNNQDDVWHWTDEYLKKKKDYIEHPEKGIARKMQAIQDYEKNLDDLVKYLKRHKVPVYIATLPIVHEVLPIIGDYPRKGYEFKIKLSFKSPEEKEKWRSLIKSAKKHYRAKDFQKALEDFQKALAINDIHPLLYHYIGQCYLALEEYDEARKMFVAGKDHQIQSPGADNYKNGALRRIAERNQCPIIETQPAFEKISPNGLVGKNLFLDHCHPNVLGHKVLASVVMSGFCAGGLMKCPAEGNNWSHWFEKLSYGAVSDENLAREYLLTAFYLLNGSSWEPLPNYKEAVYYLEKAKEISPLNMDIQAFLAASYAKLGQNAKALENLKTLKQVNPEKYKKTLADYPYLSPLEKTLS